MTSYFPFLFSLGHSLFFFVTHIGGSKRKKEKIMLNALKQQIDKIDVPSMPTPIRLRDLIRNIRACRTAAEEREGINGFQRTF